jgi:hypothetical protein
MSEDERKDRIDIELRRVINTTPPEFDAETWQRRYHKEFNTLLARAHGVKVKRLRPAFWLGIAAAIVIAGCGLVCWLGFYRTRAPQPPALAKSPAQINTMVSLSSAFRRGGMDALNKQLDEVVEQLGPRPTDISTARLLTDLGS